MAGRRDGTLLVLPEARDLLLRNRELGGDRSQLGDVALERGIARSRRLRGSKAVARSRGSTAARCPPADHPVAVRPGAQAATTHRLPGSRPPRLRPIRPTHAPRALARPPHDRAPGPPRCPPRLRSRHAARWRPTRQQGGRARRHVREQAGEDVSRQHRRRLHAPTDRPSQSGTERRPRPDDPVRMEQVGDDARRYATRSERIGIATETIARARAARGGETPTVAIRSSATSIHGETADPLSQCRIAATSSAPRAAVADAAASSSRRHRQSPLLAAAPGDRRTQGRRPTTCPRQQGLVGPRVGSLREAATEGQGPRVGDEPARPSSSYQSSQRRRPSPNGSG